MESSVSEDISRLPCGWMLKFSMTFSNAQVHVMIFFLIEIISRNLITGCRLLSLFEAV